MNQKGLHHGVVERGERLVFAALGLPSRIAQRAGLPLGRVRHLVELSYVQRALERARATGQSKGELSEAMGIGATKMSRLVRELSELFVETQHGIGLERRVVSSLWATPLTLSQIQRALPEHEEAVLVRALDALVEQGRVEQLEGRTPRYTPTGAVQRMETAPWMAMLDGLSTLVDHVSAAVTARFERGDERALVRNLTFQIAPEDIPQLRAFYEEVFLPRLGELDDAAQAHGRPVQMALSVLWAPKDEEEAGPGE